MRHVVMQEKCDPESTEKYLKYTHSFLILKLVIKLDLNDWSKLFIKDSIRTGGNNQYYVTENFLLYAWSGNTNL